MQTQAAIPHPQHTGNIYSERDELQAWDQFAASALRGLMSKVSYVDSKTFHEAANAADRMMEERRRRTPAATA